MNLCMGTFCVVAMSIYLLDILTRWSTWHKARTGATFLHFCCVFCFFFSSSLFSCCKLHICTMYVIFSQRFIQCHFLLNARTHRACESVYADERARPVLANCYSMLLRFSPFLSLSLSLIRWYHLFVYLYIFVWAREKAKLCAIRDTTWFEQAIDIWWEEESIDKFIIYTFYRHRLIDE